MSTDWFEEFGAQVREHIKRCSRCRKGWSRGNRCPQGNKMHKQITDATQQRMQAVLDRGAS